MNYKSIIICILSFTSCYSLKAQVNYGGGLSIISEEAVFAIQGRAELGPRAYRAAVAFNYVLEEGIDWAIDLDGQLRAFKIGESTDFNILAGLNVVQYNFGFGSFSERGFNVGTIIKVNGEKLIWYVEPKITINTYESFALTSGIMF